ncbi:MAG: hypothetical protein ACUVXI_02045 [bacterium]
MKIGVGVKNTYDAIIVGASFAGLSVASQLGGNVLLIDRKEPGTGQTSACGAPLEAIEGIGAGSAIMQVHNSIFVHTAHGDIELRLSHPFCTFDYGVLCKSIFEYIGETKLRRVLADFLRDRGLRMGELHGGYFPHTLREPTVGNIFLVGDSSGQCMPFTGEGIRQALYFGRCCGRIARAIIEGRQTLGEGLRLYSQLVRGYKKCFSFALSIQRIIESAPNFWTTQFVKLVSKLRTGSRFGEVFEDIR